MKRWRQMTAACMAISMMFASLPAGAMTLGEGGMGGKIYKYHAGEDDIDKEPLASPSDSEKEKESEASEDESETKQQCICETRCTEENDNADCELCSEDISVCEGKQAKPASPSDSERAEVKKVQKLIDALPTTEAFALMRPEKQAKVYEKVQEAYAAYDALSFDEKKQIKGAEILDELFAILNGQLNVLTEDIQQEVPYLDENGKPVNHDAEKVVTADSASWNSDGATDGWYVVEKQDDDVIEIDERIEVEGNVRLILADGCTLNANKGIHVNSGASLTIYAQSRDEASMGKLISDASEVWDSAGIGGNENEDGINIIICGGNIKATGGYGGAGIGSGFAGEAEIKIYDGKIEAIGGGYGAGIGSGSVGEADITISGGKVKATGGEDGAGIGSGCEGYAEITISGGKIKATGGEAGAGIGSGSLGVVDITISGGKIKATGGEAGAGIGNGNSGRSEIAIYGGNINAIGGSNGAGIGSGNSGIAEIAIYGGNINAIGGSNGAGIGNGLRGAAYITISGGNINAEGGDNAAGIGSGNYGDAEIKIYDGNIEATGGTRSAGIGSGYKGGAYITIYSGNIKATGGTNAAGIDVGYDGNFSTGESCDAIIIATAGTSGGAGIKDRRQEDKWKGLIIENGKGKIYGDAFTLTENWEIPEKTNIDILTGQMLIVNEEVTITVAEGATITVAEGATIVNRGEIQLKDGSTLQNDGELQNDVLISGYGHLIGADKGKLYGTGLVEKTVQNDFLKKSKLALTVDGECVSKKTEAGEQAYAAVYGSAIQVTASMTKDQTSSLSARLMSTDAAEEVPYRFVSFWAEDLGDDLDAAGGNGTKIALGSVEEVESDSNWKKTATKELILNKEAEPEGLAWKGGHWYRISAVYGGSMTLQGESEDSVLLFIEKGESELELKTKKDGKETSNFTYGDTITVEGKISVSKTTPANSARGMRAAALKQDVEKNYAALFYGDEQLGEAVEVDDEGKFSIKYNTGDRKIKPSDAEQTLTVKYGGSNNLKRGDAKVKITLSKKAVTASVSNEEAITKVYDQSTAIKGIKLAVKDSELVSYDGRQDHISGSVDGTFESADANEAGTKITITKDSAVWNWTDGSGGIGSVTDWYAIEVPDSTSGVITKANIADIGGKVTIVSEAGEELSEARLGATLKAAYQSDHDNETLYRDGLSYQWLRRSVRTEGTGSEAGADSVDIEWEDIEGATDATYTIQKEDVLKQISVRVTATDNNHTGSVTSKENIFALKREQGAPSGVFGGYEMISGLSEEMEYRRKGTEGWTDCADLAAGGVLKGLDAGVYEVRMKATDTMFASAAVEVTVLYDESRSSSRDDDDDEVVQSVVDPRNESGLPYMDVAVTDWFYEAVKFVGAHKLMDGVNGTSFAPYEAISRAQLATGLYRLEGSPATERADFSDMRVEPGTLSYYDAASWVWNNQLMSGFVSYDTGNIFGANELITREQLAVVFYNYAKLKGYDTSSVSDLAAFADREKVAAWAGEAVRWAVGSGLLDGKANGLLEPQSTATRAETALLLKRFSEKYRSAQTDAPHTESTGGNESR